MRSPVLIAETPFSGGHGPRFLAPPGRELNAAVAAHYVTLTRDEAPEFNEIEGEDFLAVRHTKTDDATGTTGIETLVLAGIDVDQLGDEERDEIILQLRERLDVLGDAVAAVNWDERRHDSLIELPELEEWHEAGWDSLPRMGMWATLPRGMGAMSKPEELEPEPEPVAETKPEPVVVESTPEPEPEPIKIDLTPVAALPTPAIALEMNRPKPEPKPEPKPAPKPAPVAMKPAPKPAPVKIAPVEKIVVATPPALAPVKPMPKPEPVKVTPAKVLASVDQARSLSEVPANTVTPSELAAAPAPVPPRRRRNLFPWVVLVLCGVARVWYHTQVDTTWDQHVREVYTARVVVPDPNPHIVERVVEIPVVKEIVVEKVVEKPVTVEKIVYVDKPVEKIVERIVEKPVATGDAGKADQWAMFAAEYRARMARADVPAAAEWLSAWSERLKAWSPAEPLGLAEVRADYRKTAEPKLREWTLARLTEHRFTQAEDGLSLFAASPAAKALLGATVPEQLAAQNRPEVRRAEDEFRYTRLRDAAATSTTPPETLDQLVSAYLSLTPPGKMAKDVQQMAEYRRWARDGSPATAVVTVRWGDRTPARDHDIEMTLGQRVGPDAVKRTAAVAAKPGRDWTDTVPVTAADFAPGRALPYRVKITRQTSPVEELAESVRTKSDLFVWERGQSKPLAVAAEPESGTTVFVEAKGLVDRPTLPAWGAGPAATPVSLPK